MPGRWATANLYLPKNVKFPVPGIVAIADHAIGGKAAPYNQQQGIVFSQKGYVTLVIDAPDRGEQIGGNGHFVNGVQLAVTGLWSNYFFVADALRAVDYMQTLSEYVDAEWIGMTGTSGGGATSAVAAPLDPKIKAVVPCCYIEPLHRCVQLAYTYCPEYFIPADSQGGLDWADMMAATEPRPLAPLRAMQDSLFTNAGFNEMVELGRHFYELNGHLERFQVLRTDEPHTYSAAMRDLAYRWFSKWLGSPREEEVCDINNKVYEPNDVYYTPENDEIELKSEEELAVGVKSKTNMQSLAVQRAQRYQLENYSFGSDDFRTTDAQMIHERVKDYYTPCDSVGELQIEKIAVEDCNNMVQVEHMRFSRNGKIHFEGKLLLPRADNIKRLVIYIDDSGFEDIMQCNIETITEDGTAVLALELTGMGRYYPEASEWDKYAWCDITRPVSYASWSLGTSVAHLQIQDSIAAIEWLRSRERFSTQPMYIVGVGRGAMVALMTGAIREDICGILGKGSLVSYMDFVKKPLPKYNQTALSYGVLKEFDIPVVLAAVADRLILWSNPVDADYNPVTKPEIERSYNLAWKLSKDPHAIFIKDYKITLESIIAYCACK